MENVIIPKESHKINENGEVVLQLRYNGSHPFIDEPSGKGVTATMLEVGKTYLHKNNFFYRTILNIRDKEVSYMDNFGWGVCSTQSFARTCPNEITPDEKKFIDADKDLR